MIRAEIKFKNSAFWTALENNGYKSMAEFSRQTKIRYDRLLDYANLRYIFEDDRDARQMMMALLQSDEWTLFDQYEKVIKKEGGIKKIVTDIPIDKIVSLENKSLLMLESPDNIDEGMIQESLEIDISGILETLKDRERDVIKMFFGIDRPYALDLNEIAEEVGLSRERVRQIKEKAIRRLRHRNRSYRLKPYMGHNRLKRLEKERREESKRREKYMNDNNIYWWNITKEDTKNKPWNNKQKGE